MNFQAESNNFDNKLPKAEKKKRNLRQKTGSGNSFDNINSPKNTIYSVQKDYKLQKNHTQATFG